MVSGGDKPRKSLDELMPKFEVVQISTNDFRVAFKAYDAKGYSTNATAFAKKEDAQKVIEASKAELRLKYEIMSAIADGLHR